MKDTGVLISVIVVNYNSGDRLTKCLDCLAKQRFRSFDVLVVDNGSADGSVATARAAPPDINISFDMAGENLGFAAANNRAAKSASGEWLAFLNPDAYADPGWLGAMASAIERYRGTDAFGSAQIDAGDPSRLDGAGDAYHVFGLPYRGHFGWPSKKLPPEGECFAPCAAAALYRKETFMSLGGFDESFFCYGEDVDLGFRLRLAGGRAMQIADARVLHEGSGVTGRRSDFSIYHGHRNRVWTYFKNMPAAILWPALPFHLLVNVILLARYAATGMGGVYWRAMNDAWAGLAPVMEKRRALQRERTAGLRDIARALTWSPLKAVRREADIRAAVPVGPAPKQDQANK